MKILNITLTIEDAVNNGSMYTLSFLEESRLPPEMRSQMSVARGLFRNIGAPKPGMKFRMVQTEQGTSFYLEGKLLGSPYTKLSLPKDEQQRIMARQREAQQRVAKAKARKAHLALA